MSSHRALPTRYMPRGMDVSEELFWSLSVRLYHGVGGRPSDWVSDALNVYTKVRLQQNVYNADWLRFVTVITNKIIIGQLVKARAQKRTKPESLTKIK